MKCKPSGVFTGRTSGAQERGDSDNSRELVWKPQAAKPLRLQPHLHAAPASSTDLGLSFPSHKLPHGWERPRTRGQAVSALHTTPHLLQQRRPLACYRQNLMGSSRFSLYLTSVAAHTPLSLLSNGIMKGFSDANGTVRNTGHRPISRESPETHSP